MTHSRGRLAESVRRLTRDHHTVRLTLNYRHLRTSILREIIGYFMQLVV